MDEPSWCVYDIETEKWAEDVGGWKALYGGHVAWRELGLRCVAIWTSDLGETEIYDADDLAEVQEVLEQAEVVCDFNGKRFDHLILQDLLGDELSYRYHFDLLELVRGARNSTQGGNSLEAVSQATLGRGKSPSFKGMHGAKLHRYCMRDVRLTRDLIDIARAGKTIQNGHDADLTLEIPEWFRS